MIELTRLNGNKFRVNPDLIKYFEATPDTTMTLVTGEKLLVMESCEEVAERAAEHRAEVLRSAWPDALPALNARAGHDAYLATRDQGGSTPNNAARG